MQEFIAESCDVSCSLVHTICREAKLNETVLVKSLTKQCICLQIVMNSDTSDYFDCYNKHEFPTISKVRILICEKLEFDLLSTTVRHI